MISFSSAPLLTNVKLSIKTSVLHWMFTFYVFVLRNKRFTYLLINLLRLEVWF